ncbi:MAG: PqqD family protein [Elusimicrobiota bacterium]|jgi:hypothetical protein
MPAEKFSETRVYQPSPKVAWRRVDEEAVLLDTETSEYYSLDPVAADIWELLSEGQTPAKIALSIAEDYDEKPARVSADVRALIEEFLKEGLVVTDL